MGVKAYNRLGLVFLTVGLVAGGARAEQYAFSGARSSGMAGANAATTRDSSAIWLNPAALAYMGKDAYETNSVNNGNMHTENFHLDLFGFGFGYTATEDMGRYLDILTDIDFDAFDQGSLENPEHVNSLLSMAGVLGGLDASDAIYVDYNAGLSLQIGRIGTGLRVFGEAAAWTLPDTVSISLDDYASTADFVTELTAARNNDTGFTGGVGYAYGTLSADQRADLSLSLSVAADSETIKYIDSKLGEVVGAGDLTRSEIDAAVDLIGVFASADGAASIDANQTTVVGRGFAVAEIPLSYGYAFNKNLSIGITAKAMYGTVMGANIWVFDEDSTDAVFDDISDNYESSLNFGLDLGLLYRVPNFQFALVGHNLNAPSFDGFTETVTVNGVTQQVDIPDVKIDPQVTFGAAWIPGQRFMIEADIELLKTGTLLNEYDIQRLSFGAEVDLWVLALRLGAYRNLAEDWQDWVATAGIGANIFGLRLDVGGAYGLGDSIEYDGNDIPAEARLFASIGFDY